MAVQGVPSIGILHCSDHYPYYWVHRAQFKLGPNACWFDANLVDIVVKAFPTYKKRALGGTKHPCKGNIHKIN